MWRNDKKCIRKELKEHMRCKQPNGLLVLLKCKVLLRRPIKYMAHRTFFRSQQPTSYKTCSFSIAFQKSLFTLHPDAALLRDPL